MMIVEIVAVYMTGSTALLADDFYMATHARALVIGPQARAAIVSVLALNATTEHQIRESLSSIDELAHLTVEVLQ